jgi:hypothetical protein
MKLRLAFLAAALCGCASSSSQPPQHKPDFGIPPSDLSMTLPPDMAHAVDMAVPVGCTHYNTWPNIDPQGGFDRTNVVTFVASLDGNNNALQIQDFETMTDTHPKMVTYSNRDTYALCEVCTLVAACDANGCTNKYFAQGGSVTVTRADRNDVMGEMIASASNLMLVEWDFSMSGDKPVPGGSCITINSASFDVTWPAGDGGTTTADLSQSPVDMASSNMVADLASGSDGGACHPVVNEVQTGGVTVTDEWVEVFNPCGTDLTGWKLVYRSANNNNGTADTTVFTFSSNPSGQYALLVGGGYTGSPTPDGQWASGKLAGGGGAVGLRNPSGTLIDSVSYQTLNVANALTETAPAPNPPASQSIARIPNGVDTNNNSADFQVATTPTPKAPN